MLVLLTGLAYGTELSRDQAIASLIHNVSKFVHWSGLETGEELRLCVFRNTPLRRELDRLDGQQSLGRVIAVSRADTLDEARACHLLYVGREHRAFLEFVRPVPGGQSLMVVSDIPDSARTGATLEIGFDGLRLAFVLNEAAAKASGLTISSQLYALAREVHRAP
jgi:hypothetical protein